MTRVDPEVSQLKFEHEIERLADQQSLLQSRGIFLIDRPSYPIVDLLFVPRHPLRFGTAAQHAGVIALPPGVPAGAIPLAIAEVPSLAARAFKSRFMLVDYDLRAPSLEFLDPWSDNILPYSTMFRAFEYEKDRKSHAVLLDAHPTTHKPFLCLRGIREYHEHPQHSGDDWLLYRPHMNLFSIIMTVWRASIDLVHPLLIPQPGRLQVQWTTEEKN